jgi:shikimate kinase
VNGRSGSAGGARPAHPDRPADGAVVLIGFMAAGKSAVGRAAAARLGLDFVDTDAAIEVTHGPIPAIFARGGETLFRELERDVVLDALSAAGSSPAVVALGGGAVTIEAVRAALGRSPLVLWLSAPADVLWERARRAPQGTRPLAEEEAAFRDLLAQREELYRVVATAVVGNDGTRSLDDVVDDVVTTVRIATAGAGQAGDA